MDLISHRKAMGLAAKADLARLSGDSSTSQILLNRALEYEELAALSLFAALDAEPSRSILFRSAATLALQVSEFDRAESLAYKGLAGITPPSLKNELEEVLAQARKRIIHDGDDETRPVAD